MIMFLLPVSWWCQYVSDTRFPSVQATPTFIVLLLLLLPPPPPSHSMATFFQATHPPISPPPSTLRDAHLRVRSHYAVYACVHSSKSSITYGKWSLRSGRRPKDVLEQLLVCAVLAWLLLLLNSVSSL